MTIWSMRSIIATSGCYCRDEAKAPSFLVESGWEPPKLYATHQQPHIQPGQAMSMTSRTRATKDFLQIEGDRFEVRRIPPVAMEKKIRGSCVRRW